MTEIWVVAEHTDGELQEATLEMLFEARRVSGRMSGTVCAVLLGHNVANLVEPLAGYGADRVYSVEDPLLTSYSTDIFTEAVFQLVHECSPALLMLAATANGRDYAPRLAGRLRSGFASDCVMVDVNRQGELEMTRATHGDRAYTTVTCPNSRPVIATMRPGAIGFDSPDPSRVAEVRRFQPRLESCVLRTRVIERIKADPKTLDLGEADIIVAGGRGVGSPGTWALLEELAELLGAAVGGSRMAMDLGWIPRDRLVGQTGSTVSPRLYLAAGISGAIQHTAGMRASKNKIAINNEREAPIHQLADLAAVADLREVLPALIEAVRRARRGPDPGPQVSGQT